MFFPQPPSPAILMFGGKLILTGDQTSTIQSGGAITAISGMGAAVVEVDPTVPLVTQGGAPDITGVAVVRRRIVSLTADGAGPGETLTVELVSPAGDLFDLLASIPSDPLPSPAGTIFIDARILLPLGFGAQGPTEHFLLETAVPNVPALRGGVIAFQAGNYYQATQRLEFSNPAVVVLH